MAPMKVYGWAVSPWMARALVCLEEAGAEYEVVPMSRCRGDHRRPEHLARNPFGEIPILEDGDLTLYQSRAIATYVLRKYKPELLKEGDLEGSAVVDVWLEVEAHHMEPTRLSIILLEYLGLARLSACRYLGGDNVIPANFCHFGFMRYLMATEYAGVVDAYPHVKAWWDALLARPSVRKVIAGMPPDFGYASGNIP
ncbi:hypothetical protein PAHAL_5G340500 [Panicum hallii]|uniref:glutathione transferase n=1 Tax=Panicum hallii TaxID=206008 RepID=A0A2T8IM59_9POAL|nr:hypothetical protein PAHAL_5G340500 [Panicum hallii]